MNDMHREALDSILDCAHELKLRNYRAELSTWQRELDAHMARKPVEPHRVRHLTEQNEQRDSHE